MSCFYSNKLLRLFFIAAALILIAPVYKLAATFSTMPTGSFFNILQQPLEVKLLIKQTATLALALLLLSFVFSYLLIIVNIKKQRNIACALLLIITCGGIGYLCNNQPKLNINLSSRSILKIDASQKTIIADVAFTQFPSLFQQDLLDAAAGKLKLAINQRFCIPEQKTNWYDDSSDPLEANCEVNWDHKNFPTYHIVELDAKEIVSFINTKSIRFTVSGNSSFIAVRDIKATPLTSRKDRLYIDAKTIPLEYDGSLFLSFYIMSLNGKVLRVYV